MNVEKIKIEKDVQRLIGNGDDNTIEEIVKKLNQILNLEIKEDIWMLSRNIYHTSYSKPKLIIFLLKLTLYFTENVFNDERKEEWIQSLKIQLFSINETKYGREIEASSDDSVFFYGLLSKNGIIDLRSQLEQCSAMLDGNLTDNVIFDCIIPLIPSCASLIKQEFPLLYQNLISYLESRMKNQVLLELKFFSDNDCIISPFSTESNNMLLRLNLDAALQFVVYEDNVKQLIDLILSHAFTSDIILKSSSLMCNEYLKTGINLLMYAAFMGSKECFRYLAQRFPSLTEHVDMDGHSLSFFAACGGNLEIFSMCNGMVPFDRSCIEAAIDFHHNELVFWILENYEIDLNNSDSDLTLLHHAASTNNIEIVEFLLDNNVEFWNERIKRSPCDSPLEIACKWDCLSVIFLAINSNPSALDNTLIKRIFKISITFKSEDILTYLLQTLNLDNSLKSYVKEEMLHSNLYDQFKEFF